MKDYILLTNEGEYITGFHKIESARHPMAERFLSIEEAYMKAIRFDEMEADNIAAQFRVNKFRFETAFTDSGEITESVQRAVKANVSTKLIIDKKEFTKND